MYEIAANILDLGLDVIEPASGAWAGSAPVRLSSASALAATVTTIVVPEGAVLRDVCRTLCPAIPARFCAERGLIDSKAGAA
jgi:hypothetical protein